MVKFLRRFMRDGKGATAVEYGLIGALIVVAMMAALKDFANTSITMWNNIASVVSKS